MASYSATPLEEMLGIALAKRKVTIGLPSGHGKRFPLTPEAAGMLCERGFSVRMEQGAASIIHYDDFRYQSHGVDIVDHAEALRSDIVITLEPLSVTDARRLKRGAMLLTLFDSVLSNQDVALVLLKNHIIAIALDLVVDPMGQRPFYDILSEVSGRAAIALSTALLTEVDHGKGILLGGIAGIVPCEVTIIGAGIDACAAARSAIGLGAVVRMFDNDTYRLRAAMRQLGPGILGSALHPRVLINAFRTADVIIATTIKPQHVASSEIVKEMKNGAIVFDLSAGLHPVFPSLVQIEAGDEYVAASNDKGPKVCYVHPENSVPRTVAMALSNTMLTMLSEIFTCDGFNNALLLNDGLQRAALTFLGKAVNASLASLVGHRHVDISLLLHFS